MSVHKSSQPPESFSLYEKKTNCLLPCSFLIIGAIAGVVIVTLGLCQRFGPKGSQGFTASIAAGGTLFGISIFGIICIAIANCKKHPQVSPTTLQPAHLDTESVVRPSNERSPSIGSSPEIEESTFPEELPSINSTIHLSDQVIVQILSECILIQTNPSTLGIVLDSDRNTQIMAYLLQKHQALVCALFTNTETSQTFDTLTDAIQKEFPQNTLAGLCFINGINKTFFAKTFGHTEFQMRIHDNFQPAKLCQHDTQSCDHPGKQPYKLMTIDLTVYPAEQAGLRKFCSFKQQQYSKNFQQPLLDHHWIVLKISDRSKDIIFPHPDHLGKNRDTI